MDLRACITEVRWTFACFIIIFSDDIPMSKNSKHWSIKLRYELECRGLDVFVGLSAGLNLEVCYAVY